MKPLRKAAPTRNQFSSAMLASSSDELNLPLSDVVVVFAVNEFFVPYLSVAIESIKKNGPPAETREAE